MEASDMLDVLHYFFEDDLNYSTPEQAEARDKMRNSLYGQLYQTTYRYATGANSNANAKARDFSIEDEEVQPVELKERKIDSFNPAVPPKPYVAPTAVNPNAARPFGNVIDAPLG
jgi:hypothetical protein